MADLARPCHRGYWALPLRDHPILRGLLSASDLEELARCLAQFEERQDR